MSINIKGKTVFGPNVVTDGLVLYLDAANTRSYPGSGTVWYDLSGNSNNETLSGATYNSENCGNIVFDGNDYGKINSLDLSMTNAISYCCWVKSTNSTIHILCEHSSNFNSNNAFVAAFSNEYGVSGGLVFGDHTITGRNIVRTSKAYNDNNWHYFCAISNRALGTTNQISLYVDCIFDTVQSSYKNDNSINYSTFPLYMSSRNNTKYFLSGSLGIVQLYKRAITLDEVTQNYRALKSRFTT